MYIIYIFIIKCKNNNKLLKLINKIDFDTNMNYKNRVTSINGHTSKDLKAVTST